MLALYVAIETIHFRVQVRAQLKAEAQLLTYNYANLGMT